MQNIMDTKEKVNNNSAAAHQPAIYELANKYINLQKLLVESSDSSPNLHGYTLLLNAYESIEILQAVLNHKVEKRSVDEIALIHLNYQILGSVLEKLPRVFTLENPVLARAVFAETQDKKGKAWIPRIVCAHFTSFDGLCNPISPNYHTPKLEEQMVAEILLVKTAIEETLKKHSKPLAELLVKPINISVNPSLEQYNGNGYYSVTHPTSYVDNCVSILSLGESIFKCDHSTFLQSLARQSFLILAWQFFGENVRLLQEHGVNVPSSLLNFRLKRNISAHANAMHTLITNPAVLWWGAREVLLLAPTILEFRQHIYKQFPPIEV